MLFSGLVSWRGTNTGTRGRTSLSVLTGDPKHVGLALVVGVAGRDEQKIREPVDVTECGITDRLVRPRGKRHHEPLGAPRDGAREVEETCRRRAAGKDEGTQGLKLAVQRVNLAFEPLNLRIAHGEPPAGILALVGVAKLGAEIEQIVLDAGEHGIEDWIGAAGMDAGKAD